MAANCSTTCLAKRETTRIEDERERKNQSRRWEREEEPKQKMEERERSSQKRKEREGKGGRKVNLRFHFIFERERKKEREGFIAGNHLLRATRKSRTGSEQNTIYGRREEREMVEKEMKEEEERNG